MAKSARIRRRARRKAPPVRRVPDARTAAARDTARDAGLIVGGVRDPAERSADRMAAQVLFGGPVTAGTAPVAAVRRKCAGCDDEEKKDKTAKRAAAPAAALAHGTASAPAPKAAADAVSSMGPGRGLSAGERGYFEPRFGTDFSGVRIHEGPSADRATDALQARAFAHGTDLAFAAGERSTATMAHELAHVAQGDAPVRRLDKCTSKTDPNQIVEGQTVTQPSISKPGDKALIDITFACQPRSFRSEWIDSSGTVVRIADVVGAAIGAPHRVLWDGKRQTPGVGTFAADDGTYKHRISKLAYAPGKTRDMTVANGGVASTSDPVFVSLRTDVMEGHVPNAAERAAVAGEVGPHLTFLSRHLFDASRAEITGNVTGVANAMESEAGIGNDAERDAIAWAIRNTMTRINSASVPAAKATNTYDDSKTGSAALQTKAHEILGKPMSDDVTGGAFKWYSPRSMPPLNKKTKCSDAGGTADCSGGTVTTTDGSNVTSKAPGFHRTMTFVDISGVRQNFFRFYKL